MSGPHGGTIAWYRGFDFEICPSGYYCPRHPQKYFATELSVKQHIARSKDHWNENKYNRTYPRTRAWKNEQANRVKQQ